MSKKKKRAVPVPQPKQEKKLVIDMTKIELAKAYEVPSFRTGKHMTEKDRPRKKNWKREYERGREFGKYGKYETDSLFMYVRKEWRRTAG